MHLRESVRLSWRNIGDHKLRSTLTTLGVTIGIAAVITFVTLGASLQADVIQTIAGDNTDVMYVSAGADGGAQIPGLGGQGQTVFTEHDVEQLRGVQGVQSVIPVSGLAASSVSFGDDSVGRQWVTVTAPGYFDVRGHEFVAGQPFQPNSTEVVLNRQAATMFQENVSVGDQLTITRAATREEVTVTVIGIVEEPANSQGSFLGSTPGPEIYAPPEPIYQRTVISPTTRADQRVYGRLLVQVTDVESVDAVQGRVYQYLGSRSDARILKPESDSFRVTTYEQLVEQIRDVSNTFTTYITGIAVISLVVGMIGIANIMLVSVSERTREIGIMIAIGAHQRDVLTLFLIESILLGVAGSVLGSVLGFTIGVLAAELITLPLRLRLEWFPIAVLVGVLVGAAAGIYPAWDAANTDPIDALRRE